MAIELLRDLLLVHLLLWIAIVLLLMRMVRCLLVSLRLHAAVVVGLRMLGLSCLLVSVVSLPLIVSMHLVVLLLVGHHHHLLVLPVVDRCGWHVCW